MGPKRAPKKSKKPSPTKRFKNAKNVEQIPSQPEEPAAKRVKVVTSEMADEVCDGFEWREFIQLPSENEVTIDFDAAAWKKKPVEIETTQASASLELNVGSVKKIAQDHGVQLSENQVKLFLPEIQKIAQDLQDEKRGSTSSYRTVDIWNGQNGEFEISRTEAKEEDGGFCVVKGQWNQYPQVEIPQDYMAKMEHDRKLTIYKALVKGLPKPQVAHIGIPESLRVHTLRMIRTCLQAPTNIGLTEMFKFDTTIPNTLDFVFATVSTQLNKNLLRGIGNDSLEAATCLRIFENVLENDNLDPLYIQSRLHLILPVTITGVVRRPHWPKLGHMKASWLEFREKSVALLHTITNKYQGTQFAHTLKLRMLKAFSWGLIVNLDFLEPAYGCLKGLWTLMDSSMLSESTKTMKTLEDNIREKGRYDPLSAAKLIALIREIKTSPKWGYSANVKSSFSSQNNPSGGASGSSLHT